MKCTKQTLTRSSIYRSAVQAYAHFYVYTFRINNEQAGNILRARRFTLLTLKSSSDLEHSRYSSSVSIESSFRVSQIPDIVLTKIEGKKNAFDVICTLPKKREKKKRRHVSDETRGRNAWNFGKMRTDLRTSLISLSTRKCFRGESGEEEGKGEAKRGKERQMGRGSVGRMSDFHADETYALVRCITRANTRCKQLGTVDYRW